MNTIEQIVSRLYAAQRQRSPSDDKLIAEHIDAALDLARALLREQQAPAK
jgi:hypothetical protein